MPRTPPDVPLPALSAAPPAHITLTLQTITPMFGGSASTREVDAKQPVRAASVRGHLRFWWRATAGAQYQSAEKLFEEESKIWGNTDQHGRVRVEVQVLDAGRECQPIKHKLSHKGDVEIKFDIDNPGYALFPFQGETVKDQATQKRVTKLGKSPDKAREGVQFRLTVTCPADLQAQVQTALQTWVMFGGIGSRTRRGCGSLELVSGDLPELHDVGPGPNMLTTLPGVYFQGDVQNNPLQAWAEAVGVYRDFRQGVNFARNPGQQSNRPGRSRYPEPDTLRDITRRYGHQVIHPVRGFPRANLGLPIIFHFQGQGEPNDLTLQGKTLGHQRFASPVITKVARIGGQYTPLILVLDSPDVWQENIVELKGQRQVAPEEINLPTAELNKISPQNGLPIREAFKKFVQDNGFSKVEL